MQPRSLCVVALFSFSLLPHAFALEGVRYSLFNGENLDGWIVSGCQAGVENGALVLQDGNGLVRTEHRYRDFMLDVKWRARKTEKWDSGIYFRSDLPPEGKPWPTRYQVNLKQGLEGNVGGLPKAFSAGLVKPGEWNEFRLAVIGNTAKLEINGKVAWETDGIEAGDGYVGLQAEVPLGGQYEFKDLFVTELGHRPLFNGQDLTGWEGGGDDAAKCWKVENGLLLCTGQRGPWLRSTEEYDDFNLRLEYKLKPAGNSGVYVRVPENGYHREEGVGDKNAAANGAGVEIQILDDKAEKYADLKPYQFTGSVYAIAAAEQHVGREAGRWNSLEIDCRGQSYVITHNGVVIVTANEQSFPEIAKRRLRGFLGLQNHHEEVWYRNMRIGPSMQGPAARQKTAAKSETKS